MKSWCAGGGEEPCAGPEELHTFHTSRKATLGAHACEHLDSSDLCFQFCPFEHHGNGTKPHSKELFPKATTLKRSPSVDK